MNIYIWLCVIPLTDSYHSGGGYCAIASSIEEARNMAPAESRILNPDSHPNDMSLHVNDPDFVYEIAGSPEPRMFVFPDAGCC